MSEEKKAEEGVVTVQRAHIVQTNAQFCEAFTISCPRFGSHGRCAGSIYLIGFSQPDYRWTGTCSQCGEQYTVEWRR